MRILARTTLVTIVSVAAPTGLATAPTGCGGCPHTGGIVQLATAPQTSCVALSSSDIAGCVGGVYDIDIINSCSDAMVFGGTIVPRDGNVDLQFPVDDPQHCIGAACTLAGWIGGTPISITWTVDGR